MAEGYFYAAVKHVVSYIESKTGKSTGPMIVGGLAVQLHIMNMVLNERLSPDCSHFRKTDDIDLDFPATRKREALAEIISTMPGLQAEVGERIVIAEIEREGEAKPVIRINVCGNHTDINEVLMLNISSGPRDLYGLNNGYHSQRYGRKEWISFPHVSVTGTGSFPVVSIEDLIVTKAVNGRPKDRQDLSNLAQVVKASKRELDLAYIDNALKQNVKDEIRKEDAQRTYKEFLTRIGKKDRIKNGKKRAMRQ
jgi:hypothetical protein